MAVRIDPEDVALGERLKSVVDGLPLDAAAEVAQVHVNSLRRWIKGEGTADTHALARIAEWRNASLSWLITGKKERDSDATMEGLGFHRVGVVDIQVSAGDGSSALDQEPVSYMAFDRKWLRELANDMKSLRIVTVKGDSMEPDLRPGDFVMIDQGRKNAQDGGLFVVRLDDQLLIKRVQVRAGRSVALLSANPAYSEVVVDLGSEDLAFAVIGRAIWQGREL